MNVAPHTQHQLLADLRMQLERSVKEINKLRAEKETYAKMSSGNMTTDDLLRKIRERDAEIRDIKNEYDDIEQDFIKKEKIFVDSKAYMEDIMKQIHEAKLANQGLISKNMRLHIQFS